MRTGEAGYTYKIWVGKPEGKRPLGRPGVDGTTIISN
jgi:hypothetical protein